MHTFVHTKLLEHKAVTVGANLHRLTYNVLIDVVSLIYFAISKLYKISNKNKLKTKGLVPLTEH